MKTCSNLAFAPHRITCFNLLFILVVLFGTPAFVACITLDRVLPGLGMMLDHEMRVIDVVPGGAADLGGVKPGDILEKLKGQEFTTPDQARNVFTRADSTQLVTLVLECDNNEITLSPTRAAQRCARRKNTYAWSAGHDVFLNPPSSYGIIFRRLSVRGTKIVPPAVISEPLDTSWMKGAIELPYE